MMKTRWPAVSVVPFFVPKAEAAPPFFFLPLANRLSLRECTPQPSIEKGKCCIMDYLCIGHVTEDIWQDGTRSPGGGVMFASRAAMSWLKHVTVLTAAAGDFDHALAMPGVDVRCVPAASTAQFENVYTAAGRKQRVAPCPTRLGPQHLSDDLLACPLVHIAPVDNEIEVDAIFCFPPSTFIGVAPQGWMRRWDADGFVFTQPWQDAERVLRRANAVVISEEDVAHDWASLRHWATLTPILAVTQGAKGCTLFVDGEDTQVPPADVDPIDPTGAGDAFTASLFVALKEGASPLTAAHLANCIAGHSVAHTAHNWFPTRDDVLQCIGQVQRAGLWDVRLQSTSQHTDSAGD